jgi:hypothetical protein
VNLAMPLGIGAGALVLAIGLLSILFYKCYIEVRSEVARPSTFRDTIKWSFNLEDKLVFYYFNYFHCTLIKNKIKFSSHIRKFRVEQLQSQI